MKKKNHTLLKYLIVGGVFMLLGAVLTTLTGVLLHDNPEVLFFVNFFFINLLLFVMKYLVSKKAGIIR